jgi:hypothetical protein
MKNEKDVLPVVYKIHEGKVLALFPTISDSGKYTCLSYAHIGQHGGASVDLFSLKSATPEEYEDLHKELTQIYDDYNLRIVKRVSQKMNQQRINDYLAQR